MKTFKTTKADFKLFVKECEKWIDFFGQTDWECFYDHEDIDDRARYNADVAGRIVRFTLAEEWENVEPTKHLVRKAAFHEINELRLVKILRELKWACSDRLSEELIHEIIRQEENLYFDKKVL